MSEVTVAEYDRNELKKHQRDTDGPCTS